MNELKIHDIKSLTVIPDISIYFFTLLCLFAALLISALLYFIYKKLNNKEKAKRKEYLKKLSLIDLNDSKKASYLISKYLNILAKDEEELRAKKDLEENLNAYKYKKEVKKIDEETRIKFNKLLDKLNV